MAKSRSYDYQVPSFDSTVDRAERKGSMFDSLFKDAKIYRPKQGVNLLRILPPGWSKAQHYGLTIMLHRGVGPNDRQYLCLRENTASPHKRCPICEELYNLGAKATQEDRTLYRPKASVIYYVIDRDNEKDGVQIWMSSPTTDSEIAAQSINRRTKSVIDIVHPEDGYDIEFTRTGTTRNNTRYRGFQIMREPSPLADNNRWMDEWLDIAFDKPLPSLLQFYSPEHIEEVFYGRSKEDQEEEKQTRVRARDQDADREEEEERPQIRRTRFVDEDPEPRGNSRGSPRDDVEGRENERDRDNDDRTRSRARTRDDDVDARDTRDNENTRSAPRGRDSEDGADLDARRPPRSRLSRELDDEIPFDTARTPTRGNGRDAEAEEPGSSRRARPVDDEEEVAERSSRRRRTDDEDEPARVSEPDERRARLRERLNRE